MNIEEKIYNALLDCLALDGKVTIKAVARRSGLDRTSIYYRLRKRKNQQLHDANQIKDSCD